MARPNVSDVLRKDLRAICSSKAGSSELLYLIDAAAGLFDLTKVAPETIQVHQSLTVDPDGDVAIPFILLGDSASAAYIYLIVANGTPTSSLQLRGDSGCSIQFVTAVSDKNKITLPVNLAIALSIYDGTNSLIDFVTTTGGLAVDCKVPLKLSDSGTATASGTGGTSTVTLSKQNGVITTGAITTAAGAAHVITVTNTLVAATSRILVTLDKNSSAGTPVITSVTPGSGSFTVEITNLHSANAVNAALKVHFLVLP